MLLIQSDFIKSLWFVIFPIVDYVNGPVQSDSTFCQVSGFFLAAGVESSDVAVLLIAIHSAMYLIWPKSGLYPYRRYAYAIYIIFPILVASLAFVDGRGYTNVGHYCYLANNQGWARMALSWIPRYVILVVIVFTYAFIYIYARRIIFQSRRKSLDGQGSKRASTRRSSMIPSPPPIESHGLISSDASPMLPSPVAQRDRQRSVSSVSTLCLESQASPASEPRARPQLLISPEIAQQQGPIDWNWSGLQTGSTRMPSWNDEPLSPTSVQPPPPMHFPQIREVSTDTEMPPEAAPAFWHRPLSPCLDETAGQTEPGADEDGTALQPQRSNPSIFSILRRGPAMTEGGAFLPSPEESPLSGLLSPGLLEDHLGLARNRDKIRRQLRSLVVYPLVYIFIWMFPFISHVAGYDDNFGTNDPFWLLCVSIISVSAQGAVDSALFTIREQPWRHRRGGFFKSLKRRLRFDWRGGWRENRLVGKTREEMLIDGRIARARRREEVAAERNFRQSVAVTVKSTRERDWWDLDMENGYSRRRSDMSRRATLINIDHQGQRRKSTALL
jgi:G protein-coupled receptor GPR1